MHISSDMKQVLQLVKENDGAWFIDDMDLDDYFSYEELMDAEALGLIKIKHRFVWDAGIVIYSPEAYAAAYPTTVIFNKFVDWVVSLFPKTKSIPTKPTARPLISESEL
jgi:hypothetical protein